MIGLITWFVIPNHSCCYTYIYIYIIYSSLIDCPYSSRNLGRGGGGWIRMLMTRSVLVKMGLIRAQMKNIGSGFQIMYAFLCICCNFYIHNTMTLFVGQIFWGRYWTNFLLAKKIRVRQLSLNTIELPGKSMVFENIWNFLENKHLCEISLKIPKNCIWCHYWEIIKNLSNRNQKL